MTARRTQFSPLLAPGLASIFYKNLKLRPPEYVKWLPTKTSKKAYEESYKLTGLQRFTYKAEGGVYTFDDPIPGSTLRFTHYTYALGFRVTEEMMEDDQYGIMNRMSKELSNSAVQNKEVQGFSVLDNAFSTSYVGFTSGEALCQNTHTLLNGDTLDNLVTGDFSQDGLQAALELFEAFTNDRGFKVQVRPAKVIHSPGDIWEVNKVLKSEMEANTADNNMNVIRTMFGLEPELVHHLTDTDAWFVVASKSETEAGEGARMYIRVNDKFRSGDDPMTGDAIFTGRHRISTGWGDFRWIVGSAGA